jgi:hypothetical protein
MRYPKSVSTRSALILACLLVLFSAPPAYSMDQVGTENIQAAMRTLSFLESLSKDGPIVVGVIYSSDLPEAQALAEAAAQQIATMRGPNSRALQPLVLSSNTLLQYQGHLDALWLMAGVCQHAALIADSIRQHRLVSISDDPQCADARCSVIAVRTGQRVEVTLNTALADAVGARFSLVFTMMVKRK